jgi:hypothetical protein
LSPAKKINDIDFQVFIFLALTRKIFFNRKLIY